ncbi:MAG: class I SAM-dependent methyltransferase [Thermogemmatispora sp.]|uniref:class I SAM-dependent methyltransferase n=1 Tax=Thermogemmatispora sp. TaxID=1968838 RepID=UPI002638F42C|nr:class I SAM-dependent methyltransferase [Thermogemmatispora sp.]MBX5456624.1 class I SAM-dependent methyltransferase [Thermogemmatispora sp.]
MTRIEPDDTSQGGAKHDRAIAYLMHLERLLMEGLGSALAEEEIPPDGGRVLDVACGSGSWVLELAFQYPGVEVLGIDSHPELIERARVQAWARNLEHVSFQMVTDVESLALPAASFDLIHGRLLSLCLAPKAWPRLLAECCRLLKPGGKLSLIESEGPLTTSLAIEYDWCLVSKALQRAGRSFSVDGRHLGITVVLPRLLRQAGLLDVRVRSHLIEWSQGSETHLAGCKAFLSSFKRFASLILTTGVASKEELEQLEEQTLTELQDEDFCALWPLLTVWGRKPVSPDELPPERDWW